MFPDPGPVSVRSGPVRGNSGFRVAQQVFTTYYWICTKIFESYKRKKQTSYSACIASHFKTSCQACSLLALCILIIFDISSFSISPFFHLHPFLSIAFQNICSDGYTQFSFLPALGMVEVTREVLRENGWSGAGLWLGGGIWEKMRYCFPVL